MQTLHDACMPPRFLSKVLTKDNIYGMEGPIKVQELIVPQSPQPVVYQTIYSSFTDV